MSFTGKFSIVFLVFILILTIFADKISRFSPVVQFSGKELLPPGKIFIFGTDNLGRDIFSRVLYGLRISLIIGVVARIFTIVLGLIIGCLSGYYGGIIDSILMRLIDCMLAFPALLLAILIATMLGNSNFTVIIAISVSSFADIARIVRSMVLSLKNRNFVFAAKALGANNIRIMFTHILPNCLDTIIVLFSIGLGSAILQEASLSFLGLGLTEPYSSLGYMVFRGKEYFFTAPWLVFIPCIFIAILVFLFNILGDEIRKFFDPKYKEG